MKYVLLASILLFASCQNTPNVERDEQFLAPAIPPSPPEEDRAQIDRENARINQQIIHIQTEIRHDEGQLEDANDKMATIKQFELLRTPEEKQDQIEHQRQKIQRIEDEIAELNQQIRDLQTEIH